MVEEQLHSLIRENATNLGVPAALALAVCDVESGFNPYAMRYEPTYRWLVRIPAWTSTEQVGQRISWGLMQIMGATARELGFIGYFPRLCEPAIGVQYGCRYLVMLYTKYHDWTKAIAAYNAGSPRRRLSTGLYRNQLYVDRVLAQWAAYDTEGSDRQWRTI